MDKDNHQKYAEGQIWEYKTREGEEGSLLYIVKIDIEKVHGKIFHIYLDGVKIKNPLMNDGNGGIQETLPHAPVDSTTLNKSLTKLVSETSFLPDLSEPYNTWREPFDKGDAGVFNIPVKKIVSYIEDAVN